MDIGGRGESEKFSGRAAQVKNKEQLMINIVKKVKIRLARFKKV